MLPSQADRKPVGTASVAVTTAAVKVAQKLAASADEETNDPAHAWVRQLEQPRTDGTAAETR